ncbi:MAG TPA: hypothetical protein PKE19_00625 [Aestuariivirga sp.]|nr:hypothetical protein [Aestuariivirga sp.]
MLRLFQLAVSSLGLARLYQQARQSALSGAHYAIIGLITLAGGGFLLSALRHWLAVQLGYGTGLADAMIGGGLIIVAGLWLAVVRSARPPVEMSAEDLGLQPLVNLVDSTAQTVRSTLNEPKSAMQTAAAIGALGFVAGRIMRRR